MNLDDLQTQWEEYGRRLDVVLRMNHVRLNAESMAGARSALRRQRGWAVVGIVLNAAGAVLVGLFIVSCDGGLRFTLPALAVGVYCSVNLLLHGRQAQLLSSLDYAGPVVAIQRRIDAVIRVRVRLARWLSMSMILMWAPISIVVFRALLGWDLYSVAPGWLVWNIAIGLCCIPLFSWAANKASRNEMSSSTRRFIWRIAGGNLNAARTFLNMLSEFEREG